MSHSKIFQKKKKKKSSFDDAKIDELDKFCVAAEALDDTL